MGNIAPRRSSTRIVGLRSEQQKIWVSHNKEDAEVKLGEMLKEIPLNIESSGRGKIVNKPSLPNGISYKESHIAQTLKNNLEIVEQAKAMELEAKIENLLFVIWVQDQRHEYWMKVLREIKRELETLREEMDSGDNLFDGQGSGEAFEA